MVMAGMAAGVGAQAPSRPAFWLGPRSVRLLARRLHGPITDPALRLHARSGIISTADIVIRTNFFGRVFAGLLMDAIRVLLASRVGFLVPCASP